MFTTCDPHYYYFIIFFLLICELKKRQSERNEEGKNQFFTQKFIEDIDICKSTFIPLGHLHRNYFITIKTLNISLTFIDHQTAIFRIKNYQH